jgi:hypothetical protein
MLGLWNSLWFDQDWRSSALVLCGVVIAGQFYLFIKKTFSFPLKRAKDAPLKGEDGGPVHLHVFGDNYPLVSGSPFSSKIVLYCRLAGIPHTTNESVSKLNRVPKRKIPFAFHGGYLIEDSQLIIRYIENTFDVNASAEAVPKMFETNWKPFKCYALLDDNQKVTCESSPIQPSAHACARAGDL